MTETETTNVDLGLERIDFLPHSGRSVVETQTVTPAGQFRLELKQAATELPTLKALFVTKLVEPYLEYDYLRKKPTRDSPTELSAKIRFIRARLEEIVVFSGVTGEIFLRLSKKPSE